MGHDVPRLRQEERGGRGEVLRRGSGAQYVVEPGFLPARDGVGAGDELLVLTWLDRASRDVLRVHPRDDAARPERRISIRR